MSLMVVMCLINVLVTVSHRSGYNHLEKTGQRATGRAHS